MTLYKCNGCEMCCLVDFDLCGDDPEKPGYCLFDGRKLNGREGWPKWYPVVEVVSYREVSP